MSLAIELVRAILGTACASDEEAVAALDDALGLEAEPLDVFAHRFGLGKTMVMERAAGWVGLAFAVRVPQTAARPPRYDRLDSLAEARFIRERLFDRDIGYSAPRFSDMLKLREQVAAHPELHQRLCLVPEGAIREALVAMSEDQLIDESRQRLARRWPFASASFDLPLAARIAFVGVLVVITAIAVATPFLWKPLLIVPLAILIVPPALARLAAVFRGRSRGPVPPLLDDAALPTYSVLVPLRDEANMVPQLERALMAIDYPAEKLDIKFLVESGSAETIDAVKGILDDLRFELVVIPDAAPQTKPKALDFALPLVRGKHVVIFDAEDIPDPGQLRLAASRFAADAGVDCLQAELVVDNAGENGLTALFAGEYAGLFGLLLPLFARWRLPVPLGGTSNHFRADALREVGGWDAFNVTEDADLGVRLARLRYRTATLESTTSEEAPISLAAWTAQRTRWMKGWMQTFVVHNRSPRQFLADIGWRGFLAFEIYVGGLIVSPLLHSVFLLSLLASWISGQAGIGGSEPWDAGYIAILLIGYGAAFALTVAGLVRLRRQDLVAWQLLLPFYWVLHTVATVRAAGELLTRPYFWAKTAHGRTRLDRSRFNQPPLGSSLRSGRSRSASSGTGRE